MCISNGFSYCITGFTHWFTRKQNLVLCRVLVALFGYPRLIGVDNALEIITAGKDINAETALKNGLIQAIVPVDKLKESAISLIEQAIDGKFDWQAARQPKTVALKD